jgi:hypothetical protein
MGVKDEIARGRLVRTVDVAVVADLDRAVRPEARLQNFIAVLVVPEPRRAAAALRLGL